jgi:hypothetical protein
MRILSLCFLTVSLPACSSSGPRTAEVSGTVRLDGQLVEEGSIQFIPVDGTSGPSAGAIIKKGKYQIDSKNGATVGKNRVELRAFKETDVTVPDPTGPSGSKTKQRVPAFPPEYNEQSTLVKEVKSGSNTIDFDVRINDQK